MRRVVPHRSRIVLLLCPLILAACAPSLPARTTGSTLPLAPAASAPRGSWNEGLTFSGQVQGTMTAVVPSSTSTPDGCTGPGSLRTGSWASSIYGPVGSTTYGLLITVTTYRGPGTYQAPQVSVQVLRPDGSAVWQTEPGDPATFTVDADQLSGTIDASLTNLETGTGQLRVSGAWSCAI